jgi:hypothetical protein
MTEPDSIRVFVNGTGLSVAHGKTVIDAVRAFDLAEAEAAIGGARAVTDSRGLPLPLDTPLTGGTVLRIVSARALRSAEDSG